MPQAVYLVDSNGQDLTPIIMTIHDALVSITMVDYWAWLVLIPALLFFGLMYWIIRVFIVY